MPPRRKGAGMKVSASTVMLAGLKPGTYVSETSEAKSKEQRAKSKEQRAKRRDIVAFDRRSPPFAWGKGAKEGAPSRSIES